jgi:hypothetical protein
LSLEDDDSEDETLTKEEKEQRKKKREAMLQKQALSLRKRRGKGGSNGALPGARVGYTPVYYQAPMLSDGTEVRSCLKGRGRTAVLKTSLVWGENLPMHFYPPENPKEGGDSDGEDTSKPAKGKDTVAAVEKRRLAEEKRRERAKARQEAKDAELFGRSRARTTSPPLSDSETTTGSPVRASVSVSSIDPDDISKPAEFCDVSQENSKGVKPNPVGNGESVAANPRSDDAAKTPDTAKKSKKTKISSAESSPATPSSTSKSESKPKSEKSPGKEKKLKATGSPKKEGE